MTNTEPEWAGAARASMEEFIRAVGQQLPAGANIGEIERVLLREYPQVLRDVLQSIVDTSTPPPPGDAGNLLGS